MTMYSAYGFSNNFWTYLDPVYQKYGYEVSQKSDVALPIGVTIYSANRVYQNMTVGTGAAYRNTTTAFWYDDTPYPSDSSCYNPSRYGIIVIEDADGTVFRLKNFTVGNGAAFPQSKVSNFVFAPSGAEIIANVTLDAAFFGDRPSSLRPSIVLPCSRVFSAKNSTLLFGSSPLCYWELVSSGSQEQIRILLSSDAAMMPGNSFYLNAYFYTSLTGMWNAVSRKVGASSAPLPPVAKITAPSVFSTQCLTDLTKQVVTINSYLSYTSTRRSMSFAWSLDTASSTNLPGDIATSVASVLAASNGAGVVSFTAAYLGNDTISYTMIIKLTVTDFLGNTATTSAAVEKREQLSMQVTLGVSTDVPIATTLDKQLSISSSWSVTPSCSANQSTITYNWEYKDTDEKKVTGLGTSALTRRTLVIPPWTLPASNQVYSFRLKAINTKYGITAYSPYVQIQAVPNPLVAVIAGGASRQVGYISSFELDASKSYDMDKWINNAYVCTSCVYSWSCSEQTCDNLIAGNRTAAVLRIGGQTLLTGSYVFTVQISSSAANDIRTSQTSVSITVVPTAIPSVSCTVKGLTGKGQALREAGVSLKATVDSAAAIKSIVWQVIKGDMTLAVGSTVSSDSLTTNALVIAPNVLVAGCAYSIQIRATDSANQVGSSTCDFIVHTPPSPGALTALTQKGRAVLDTFSFVTSGWISDEQPIKFQFGTIPASVFSSNVDDNSKMNQLKGLGDAYQTSDGSASASLILPAGDAENDHICVAVVGTDSVGSRGYAFVEVISSPPVASVNDTSVVASVATEAVASLSNLVANDDMDKALQTMSSVSALVQQSVDANPCSPPRGTPSTAADGTLLCYCTTGYMGATCSMTESAVNQMTSIAYAVVDAISTALSDNPTPGQVLQSLDSISSLTSIASVVSPQLELSMLDNVKNLTLAMTNSGTPLSAQELKNIAAKALGPLNGLIANLKLQNAQGPKQQQVTTNSVSMLDADGTGSTADTDYTRAKSLFETINSVANMLMGTQDVNTQEYVQVVNNMALLVKRIAAADLSQSQYAVGPAGSQVYSRTRAQFLLPDSILYHQSLGSEDVIGIKGVVLSANPYKYSPSSYNMSIDHSIVDLTLTNDTTMNELLIQNLDKTVTICVPGQFSATTMGGKAVFTSIDSVDEDGLLVECNWWNDKLRQWSSNGCTVMSMDASCVYCSCVHLTTFGASIRPVLAAALPYKPKPQPSGSSMPKPVASNGPVKQPDAVQSNTGAIIGGILGALAGFILIIIIVSIIVIIIVCIVRRAKGGSRSVPTGEDAAGEADRRAKSFTKRLRTAPIASYGSGVIDIDI